MPVEPLERTSPEEEALAESGDRQGEVLDMVNDILDTADAQLNFPAMSPQQATKEAYLAALFPSIAPVIKARQQAVYQQQRDYLDQRRFRANIRFETYWRERNAKFDEAESRLTQELTRLRTEIAQSREDEAKKEDEHRAKMRPKEERTAEATATTAETEAAISTATKENRIEEVQLRVEALRHDRDRRPELEDREHKLWNLHYQTEELNFFNAVEQGEIDALEKADREFEARQRERVEELVNDSFDGDWNRYNRWLQSDKPMDVFFADDEAIKAGKLPAQQFREAMGPAVNSGVMPPTQSMDPNDPTGLQVNLDPMGAAINVDILRKQAPTKELEEALLELYKQRYGEPLDVILGRVKAKGKEADDFQKALDQEFKTHGVDPEEISPGVMQAIRERVKTQMTGRKKKEEYREGVATRQALDEIYRGPYVAPIPPQFSPPSMVGPGIRPDATMNPVPSFQHVPHSPSDQRGGSFPNAIEELYRQRWGGSQGSF